MVVNSEVVSDIFHDGSRLYQVWRPVKLHTFERVRLFIEE